MGFLPEALVMWQRDPDLLLFDLVGEMRRRAQ